VGPEQEKTLVAVEGRSRKGTVTGKLRVAIEAMIWQGTAEG
jgi:hypothetical protein